MNQLELDEFVVWLFNTALGTGVVLTLQLLALALAALMVSCLLTRVDASRNDGVWLAATMVACSLVPIHLFSLGWSLPIATATVERPIEYVRGSLAPGQDTFVEYDDINAENSLPATADVSPSFSRSAMEIPATKTNLPGIDQNEDQNLSAGDISQSFSWFPPLVTAIVMSVYIVGLLIAFTRLFHSAYRVRRIVRRTIRSDSSVLSETKQIAQLTGCGSRFQICQSDEVVIPMVVGITCPVILLPSDFPTWSLQERRATLLHELTHVKRRDVFYRHLSLFSRTVYWFHPASHFIDRRLSESCEWATDREAIAASTALQMDAGSYAESLISVVSRATKGPRSCTALPVVAMSAFDDIEHRLRLIVTGRRRRDRYANWISQLAIVVLLIFSGLFALRLDVVQAQSPADPPPKPSVESVPAKETLSPRITQVKPEHSDLWNRIRDARLSTSHADAPPIAVVSVSGIVKDSRGLPVPDAIVLLRDSSTSHLSYDRLTVTSNEELYLREVNDILATTKTDSQGRFQFQEIPAPDYVLPDIRWSGCIVAAHRELGAGYFNLSRQEAQRYNAENISIPLRPSTSIEGQVVSSDNQPVKNAVVSVVSLHVPNGRGWQPQGFLDLQGSQISPRVVTKADGRFSLSNVPASSVAILSVYDPTSTGAYVAVKTTNELYMGNLRSLPFTRTKTVLETPATITTDPGISIHGTVLDESGNPVSNARVHFGAMVRSFLSDQTGHVDLQIPLSFKENFWQPHSSTLRPIPITILPDDRSEVLPARLDYSTKDGDYGKPFTAVLPTPISVKGRVVDLDGDPLEGIGVRSTTKAMHRYGLSDANGDYEVLVPKGKHQLVYFSDRKDLDLPRRKRGFDLPVNLKGYLTRSVDVSDAKPKVIDSVIVPKLKAIQVTVMLPNGTPAKNAAVVLRDEKTRDGSTSYSTMPMVEEKSAVFMTDSEGTAMVLPQGQLSASAWFDCTMIHGERAFVAHASYSKVLDETLKLQLKETALITGRVLANGKPTAGAIVWLEEHRTYPSDNPSGQFNFTATFTRQIATTDQDGRYRFVATHGRKLYVTLHSVPSLPQIHVSEHVPLSAIRKVIRVKDFALRFGSRGIQGQVIDENGTPVAGVSIRAMPDKETDPYLWNGFLLDSHSKTDDLGNFQLNRLPGGKLFLYVERERRPPHLLSRRSTVVEVGPGNTSLLIRLPGSNVKR